MNPNDEVPDPKVPDLKEAAKEFDKANTAIKGKRQAGDSLGNLSRAQ